VLISREIGHNPHMNEEAIAKFKENQRERWKHFAPLEAVTTPAAPRLVRFANVQPGQRVLDVACGTGVVAITAARTGARVNGLDLTPELLERARENAEIANVEIEFREGDVEALPFADSTFDVVLSQFGHMFAPRPTVAIAEMLRVLKSGGTIAFATWPPELSFGTSFNLIAKYMPPPPGVPPPAEWGDPAVVRLRLGSSVAAIVFDRACIFSPALSVPNYRTWMERAGGPLTKVVESLSASDPTRLAEFRHEYDRAMAPFFDNNVVRQGFLLTRASKR
jgi:SAM-dependent methyltransferase